ncbi:aminomethyl-transferring glycine dehydrogenase subunit GcvPA [Terrisporobacter mayombei]|uniref:Glycine dehydrogenase (Decarboxylating) subunit 1 n=1 Tax=Terrisporobacter mayombei TaxID=1541 RepID=A0ABY9PZA2_9FIRM|nr:aminomethyl-transferring glycine dehydrogenase subunit GcvPA [Terrisporobacter mayombei]MCC3866814.1 aminomethyl-transferring glycine dehydrogenase subunit GcvPA [Terrisporobacter mayombei]WMT81053.1 putative glycine dehydrogenase (decarboxylating) subunit 1 [Terrisporobacter mayombei]
MSIKGLDSHPYIPNSVKEVQDEMLQKIGLRSLDELHSEVPDSIRLNREMNLPKAIHSEYALKSHIEKILKRNITCEDNLNFLGYGCYQHYVPAVCDEVNTRAEFLTAYGGEPYNDFGRFQSLFEYESLVAELVDMDVVSVPTFDLSQAASTAVRMASRINGRKEALVPKTIHMERFLVMKNYCDPDINFIFVDYDKNTGLLDLNDLKDKMNENVCAVYIENPSALGFIETQGQEISDIAHEAGSISIVGVDPISLGVIAPPSQYGADIVVGDVQVLGNHMNFGGGQAGFISTRDEEEYVLEYPSRLFGIAPTDVEGEYGFGDVAYDRTSFGNLREQGKEFVGTQSALLGITAGVYLSLMGPKGMYEVGQTIMQNSQYAAKKLSEIDGVSLKFNSPFFKEFILDFNSTNKAVKDINSKLLEKGIFAGKDLSEDYKELGQCGLYCVTEIHTKEMIDTLVEELKNILN